MRTRLLACVALLVAALLISFSSHPIAQTGGATTIKAIDTSTGATTNVGDNTNHAVRTNCVSGCSGGTTDTDDASIATGQSTGLSLALGQAYDGSVWRRVTFGTAGTASAQVWTIQGVASMTPVQVSQATGTNLHMVCDTGCSSSTAPADEAAFTAGSTSQSPIGGFFQTTATSNALTNGQMGAWQFTANRAGFINLRNASGTEVGTSGTPLQVSLANTGANGTAIVSSATLQTQTDTVMVGGVNIKEINAVTPLMGAGNTGTGSLRVTVSTDQAALAGMGVGATGSAVPANANYLGGQDASGFLYGDIVCTNSKIYDASTSGNTELVAISGSKHIYVCGYTVFAAGTVNVSLVTGTGTACASAASGTPSTGTSGAAAALTPAYQLVAQTGKIQPAPTHGWLYDTGSANALCLKTSAGIAVQAEVWYSQR